MKEWIFKLIWVPSFVIVVMCSVGISIYPMKEVGWNHPYRWICMIGLLAYCADKMVNK